MKVYVLHDFTYMNSQKRQIYRDRKRKSIEKESRSVVGWLWEQGLLAASVNPLTVREFVGVTEMSKTLCHYEDGCISLYEKLLNCTLKMGNFMVLNDTFINLKEKKIS